VSRVRDCGPEQAAKRLHDATAFLEIAEIAEDSDVKATNAIHSAIAPADALCCLALRRRFVVPSIGMSRLGTTNQGSTRIT
jgi:hypothetical protein